MKAMSKLIGYFVGIGVLKYVADAMPHDGRVFKDCIKFVREATDAERRFYLSHSHKKPVEKASKVQHQLGHFSD